VHHIAQIEIFYFGAALKNISTHYQNCITVLASSEWRKHLCCSVCGYLTLNCANPLNVLMTCYHPAAVLFSSVQNNIISSHNSNSKKLSRTCQFLPALAE